ncbi:MULTISPECIES: hypothetical protein [unclassified Mycoplasma]
MKKTTKLSALLVLLTAVATGMSISYLAQSNLAKKQEPKADQGEIRKTLDEIKSLLEQNKENEAFKDAFNSINEIIAKTEESLNSSTQDQLDKNNENLKSLLQRLKEEIEKYKQLANQKAIFDSKTNDNKNLIEEINQWIQTNKVDIANDNNYETLNASLSKNNELITQATNDNDLVKISSQNDELKTNFDNAKNTYNQINEQLKKENSDLINRANELLTKTSENADKYSQEITQNTQALEDKNSDLVAKNDSLKTLISDLENQITKETQDAENNNQNNQNTDLVTKLTELKKALDSVNTESSLKASQDAQNALDKNATDFKENLPIEQKQEINKNLETAIEKAQEALAWEQYNLAVQKASELMQKLNNSVDDVTEHKQQLQKVLNDNTKNTLSTTSQITRATNNINQVVENITILRRNELIKIKNEYYALQVSSNDLVLEFNEIQKREDKNEKQQQIDTIAKNLLATNVVISEDVTPYKQAIQTINETNSMIEELNLYFKNKDAKAWYDQNKGEQPSQTMIELNNQITAVTNALETNENLDVKTLYDSLVKAWNNAMLEQIVQKSDELIANNTKRQSYIYTDEYKTREKINEITENTKATKQKAVELQSENSVQDFEKIQEMWKDASSGDSDELSQKWLVFWLIYYYYNKLVDFNNDNFKYDWKTEATSELFGDPNQKITDYFMSGLGWYLQQLLELKDKFFTEKGLFKKLEYKRMGFGPLESYYFEVYMYLDYFTQWLIKVAPENVKQSQEYKEFLPDDRAEFAFLHESMDWMSTHFFDNGTYLDKAKSDDEVISRAFQYIDKLTKMLAENGIVASPGEEMPHYERVTDESFFA